MRVIATDVGFDNLCIRNVGDVFEMPDDVFDLAEGPLWFEPADADVKAKVPKRAAKSVRVPAVDPGKQAADQAAAINADAARQATDAAAAKGTDPVRLKV